MDPQNQQNQPNPTPQDPQQEGMQDYPQPQPTPMVPSPVQPQPAVQYTENPAVPPADLNQPVAQQQYMPQPQSQVDPMGPVAPAPTPIMSQPQMQSDSSGGPLGGLNKKLIIWIAAGVGVLVVIAIAAVVIASSFAVSKADYEEAYERINDAKTSYNDLMGPVSINTYGTATEMKNDLEEFKKTQKEFNDNVATLGKLKAVQRDAEAKKLYDAALEKKIAFDKAVAALLETYEYVLPAMAEFNNASSSDIKKLIAVVSSAADKLEADESKLQNSTNKELVNKIVPLFKKYAALLKKVEIYRKDYTKYDSKVASEYSSTSSEISTAIRDWSSNMKSLVSDAEIASEFSDLSDYLSKKSLGES
jgi:hypothetical protein